MVNYGAKQNIQLQNFVLLEHPKVLLKLDIKWLQAWNSISDSREVIQLANLFVFYKIYVDRPRPPDYPCIRHAHWLETHRQVSKTGNDSKIRFNALWCTWQCRAPNIHRCESTDRRTDRRKDGSYKVHYLPVSWFLRSIKMESILGRVRYLTLVTFHSFQVTGTSSVALSRYL